MRRSLWLACLVAAAMCFCAVSPLEEGKMEAKIRFQKQQERVMMANALVEGGHGWLQAAEIYEELIIGSGPLGTIDSAEDRARILVNLATAYRSGLEWRKALLTSRKAMQEDPQLADGFLGEGQALMALGQHVAAAESFNKAGVLADKQGQAQIAHQALAAEAQCLLSAGSFTQSRTVLLALMKRERLSPDVLTIIASLFESLGELKAAKQARTKAQTAQRTPSHGPNHLHRSTKNSNPLHAEKMHAYTGNAKPAHAIDSDEETEEDVNASPEYVLHASDGYIRRNMPAKAIAILQPFTRRYPDHFMLRNSLALALTMTGQHEAAVRELEHALRLHPEDAVTIARLIHAKASLCDWRGRDALTRALSASLKSGQDCMSGLKGDCVEPVLTLYASLNAEETALVSHKACKTVQMSALALRSLPFTYVRSRSRLRVGYVTSDIRMHATSYLARSMFGMHDRKQLEVCITHTHMHMHTDMCGHTVLVYVHQSRSM
jgi:tetratricopeptide (TPR) repeat protein